jgi:hypothetical protein
MPDESDEIEEIEELTYESFRIWRAICEYLFYRHGDNALYSITSSDHIQACVRGSYPYVDFDKTKRDELKRIFGFSLIVWNRYSRRRGGWCLQQFWEEKLWFLEQVIVLGRDRGSLPRPWDMPKLTKAYEQDFKSELDELNKLVESLTHFLDALNGVHVRDEPEDLIRARLRSIRTTIRKARVKLLPLPELNLKYKPKEPKDKRRPRKN